MGQCWASLKDKLQGRRWTERQVRKIADDVFDRLNEDSMKRETPETEALTFEKVYTAVQRVYTDMNKCLPGEHDPPSEDKVRAFMDEFDISLDGLLDREEFAEFIRKMTAVSIFARN